MAAPDESGHAWPEWIAWRRRLGPMPPVWDRPWVPPWARTRGLPAPWQESIRTPDLPPAGTGLPAAKAEPPAPARVPVSARLGFVLFGAVFAVPPAAILLVVFGRSLGWADWIAYLMGGGLGLAALGTFFLGLTAGHGNSEPAA